MKFNNKIGLGTLLGILSGVFWAIDTIMMSFLVNNPIGIIINNIVFIPFIIAGVKDNASAIFLATINKNKLKKIFKDVINKKLNVLILAAILGGPAGMICYISSIKYIGVEVAANMSALYPIVTAMLSSVIVKEKLSRKNKIGVFISFIGIFSIGYCKVKYEINGDFLIGVSLISLTILCWALESILYSVQIKKYEISSEEALTLREFVTSIIHLFIVGYIIITTNINIDLIFVKNIYLIIIASIISIISYLLWYKSISKIGPAKATTLNVTYVFWVVLFQILLRRNVIRYNFIIGSIMIIIGSSLVFKNK